MDSIPGLQFSLWLSLKKNHPEVTLEVVKDIMTKVSELELMRRRDMASGTDIAGNSIGLTIPTSAESPGEKQS